MKLAKPTKKRKSRQISQQLLEVGEHELGDLKNLNVRCLERTY